ncbi:hypothetical protein BY996DRAFT_7108991 [Phakopsora pachyrhizi]|nr:hypothetical protein BY996DRAFT_7108991 [Phakopsora pachyrhizi]
MKEQHPIWYILNDEFEMGWPTSRLSILSSHLQISFVFHIALCWLKRWDEKDGSKDHTVAVVGKSQSEFKLSLSRECDHLLSNYPRDEEETDRLSRIRFSFCPTLPHLITFLCNLCNQSSKLRSINTGDERLESESRPRALIIFNSCQYISSSPEPTLSSLVELLILIRSVQSFMSSSSDDKNFFPIYLLDRIDHTENWKIKLDSKDSGSVLRVIQNFFEKTWTIEQILKGRSLILKKIPFPLLILSLLSFKNKNKIEQIPRRAKKKKMKKKAEERV